MYADKRLETPRLILRPFCVSDAEAMFRNWAADPLVTKYLTWEPHKKINTVRALLARWEEAAKDPSDYHWAIVSKERGEAIGDLSVVHKDERCGVAELGYCLSRAEWGKGLMTEAVSEVLRYLFEDAGFYRVYALHAVGNAASGRVMEKCGMRTEGIFRGHYVLLSTGDRADICVKAVLRDEYFERKGGNDLHLSRKEV